VQVALLLHSASDPAQPTTLKLLASPQYGTELDTKEVPEELPQLHTPELRASPQYGIELDAEEVTEELSQLEKNSEAYELEEIATPEETIKVEEGKLGPRGLEVEARVGGVKRSAPEGGEDDETDFWWQASQMSFKRKRVTDHNGGVVQVTAP